MINYKIIFFTFVLITLFYCISKKNKLKEFYKKTYSNIKKTYEKFNCQKDIIDTNIKYNNIPIKYESQKDFEYHSENLNSSEAEKLYKFLQSMIVANNTPYERTSSFSKKIKVNPDNEKILINFLNLKFDNNSISKKIKNISLIDKIFFYKNTSCLELQPFQIQGDYYFDKKYFGKVKIQIELSFRFDRPNTIFLSQTIFNNYMGAFEFNRITLIGHQLNNVEAKKKNLPVILEKPKSNIKYDFDYNKLSNKEPNILDTVNSLIPDNIDITEYELDSENVQTAQKIKV